MWNDRFAATRSCPLHSPVQSHGRSSGAGEPFPVVNRSARTASPCGCRATSCHDRTHVAANGHMFRLSPRARRNGVCVTTLRPSPLLAKATTVVVCGVCGQSFPWSTAYWQNQTPGARDSAGYTYIARAFCPHCGMLVCDGPGSSWRWYGAHATVNDAAALPIALPYDPEMVTEVVWQSTFGWWIDRHLPRDALVPVSRTQIHPDHLQQLRQYATPPLYLTPRRTFRQHLAALWAWIQARR